jgi:hypothetical protein
MLTLTDHRLSLTNTTHVLGGRESGPSALPCRLDGTRLVPRLQTQILPLVPLTAEQPELNLGLT